MTRLFVLGAALVVPALASAQNGDSAKASLYTEAQAARGERVHRRVCMECHETLDYRSVDFKAKWNGRPAFNLVDLMRTTMPDEKPGSLTAQEYSDVVAYMLRLNGVPAGSKPLPVNADSLKKLTLDLPPRR